MDEWAEFLEPHVSSPTAAKLGGFLIVFCGVLLLGAMVSWIVGKFLRVTGLSIVDHLLAQSSVCCADCWWQWR